MTRSNITRLVRAAILSSLAALMVAGFLVLGGLGGGDSAEALRCSKKWFNRCPSYQTTETIDLNQTVT